ncbi:MAG: Branched-chain amino acid transport ATP-binding protein LivF [Firmicutes bacterium]|nr:Branched-chain amino acid transport ATP-binding protein LivF [Bacillota bacterium]MDI6705579.1 ABC transporter ATP-binding protein [Bacillota bacterium]
MSENVLVINDLNVMYGKMIHAIKDLSMDVRQGEIVAVLGANGAGKSTLLKTISGLLKPKTGSIKINNQELVGIPAHKVLSYGVAHVPEGRMIVPHFSVKENLLVGAYIADKKSVNGNIERVMEIFPKLKERLNQTAGTLSGGEQQMLAIGRALMSEPKILLLDEPSLGLAPILVDKVMEMVQLINKTQGVTVMLVEQNVYIALDIADRAYVLENGYITMSGSSAELKKDETLKKQYLAG